MSGLIGKQMGNYWESVSANSTRITASTSISPGITPISSIVTSATAPDARLIFMELLT